MSKSKNKKLKQYFYFNMIPFILLIIGDFGEAISMVIWSVFMKELSDTAVKANIAGIKNLVLLGAVFLVFYFLVFNFKTYWRRYFLRKVNYQVKADIFNSILSKNINDFNDTNSAKYISILNNDVATIENDYFNNIPNIVENIITFLVATAALFVYEPLIGIVALLTSFIPLLIPTIFGKTVSQKQGKYFRQLEVYNTKIKDIFNGFEVIKSFAAEREVRKLHNNSAKDVENSRFNFRTSQNLSVSIQYTLTYLEGIIQLVFSIYLVLKGRITFGVLMGTMQVSNYVSNPIREAASQMVDLKAVRSIKLKIENILNGSKKDSKIANVGEKLIEPAPIILNDLSFGYDAGKSVLKNINFRFEKGKKYALVGSSGAGKSTLIKLIMKYYNNYDGDITISTQNLRSIDKTSLNDSFSMIHQHVILFDDTIRNNITMFKDYTDEAVLQAVKDSGLENLINTLPDGLETNVNESGNNFSGGQQQRISIARAFLKNTSVMLLDEATASLDNKMAMQIENVILNKKELTAIVITHKLIESILKRYDCIVALNHGEIVEYGSFNKLMDEKEYFYSLYTINN